MVSYLSTLLWLEILSSTLKKLVSEFISVHCFHFSVTIRLFVIIILRKKNKLTALLSTGSGSTSSIRILIHVIVSNPAAVPTYA